MTPEAERLAAALRRHPDLTIAVSGGVDSMTLAAFAHRTIPTRMVHAESPAVPIEATARLRDMAHGLGWDLRVVEAGEFSDPDYLRNPVNRCFFCKSNLYDRIGTLTDGPIASGANTDDLGDYRPGLDAARRRGVVHPLIEAGIDKAGVRRLARRLGLGDVAELPAQPCLSSRVETGLPIRAEDLRFIHAVERAGRELLPEIGTLRCRVLHEGVVIETSPLAEDERAALEALAAAMAADAGRPIAGWRPYRRGSAFLTG
ncbi:adenine nucleotide alpha hydrolase [Tropicimonas sp. IMCC34011]|uniref:adenine nucleotide alpha hydrolase n=1 Tax=Tropicimonas sp. IMCC34011 TaxID=2248759 RepID=UPI000E256001|nr:adenine nucleotide alpha hydrolase [Tropicimonas sp. IMCC34011]